MPKPTNKSELINAAQENYGELMAYVDSLSSEELHQEFLPGTLNRNIRDVLAHLHHWHVMFLDWYTEGMAGRKPDMPAKGYTWKETPLLNRDIRKKYASTDVEKVKRMLNASFREVLSIAKIHSQSELFDKKRYSWTGSTSLAAYLIANTSSHYRWALNLIKRSK